MRAITRFSIGALIIRIGFGVCYIYTITIIRNHHNRIGT